MEVQDGLDFPGGLAAASCKGHGERSRDIERGEDQVPVASRELFVAVDGEGVHRGRYAGVGGRQPGGKQDRQEQSVSWGLNIHNAAIVATPSGTAEPCATANTLYAHWTERQILYAILTHRSVGINSYYR